MKKVIMLALIMLSTVPAMSYAMDPPDEQQQELNRKLRNAIKSGPFFFPSAKRLIAQGADAYDAISNRDDSLLFSNETVSPKILQFLIQHGDARTRDKYGKTGLMRFIDAPEIIQAILEDAQTRIIPSDIFSQQTNDPHSRLGSQSLNRDIQNMLRLYIPSSYMKTLLSAQDSNGETALMTARKRACDRRCLNYRASAHNYCASVQILEKYTAQIDSCKKQQQDLDAALFDAFTKGDTFQIIEDRLNDGPTT